MTYEAAYVKTETLSPNAEEFTPAPGNSDGGDDEPVRVKQEMFTPAPGNSDGGDEESVRVKQEMIFLPENMGMKVEEEPPRDDEDTERVDDRTYQYENALSPSSWRLLEVTHETDCADRTPAELRQVAVYPDRCGPPQRDCAERDPFSPECAGDPLRNGAPRRKEKRTAERFHCAHCGKTFFSKYCITKHVFGHEPGVPAPSFVCELCGAVFADGGELSRHVAGRGCASEGPAERLGAGPGARLPPVCRIRPFACQACGATFARRGHLKVHQAIHAGDRPHACDVCGKRFRQSVHLTIHRRLHSDERPYSCEVCGKAFRQSVHLQIHLRLHTGYRPFSCDVCGRTFPDRTGLTRHKIVHSRDHPFGCEVCGKSFREEDALREHRARNGCVAGPYPCDKCGRSFADPFALERHVRVHEGKKRKPCDVCGDGGLGGRACRHDRPYLCKVCGKAFARTSSLKRHVGIHVVAERFECGDCHRTFKWESSLSGHKCGPDPTPKQFSCDVCGKRFRFRHNAEAHYKVHTGESTHSCEVCGKLCNSAANLRSHYTVHSTERPYTCETCGKAFRRAGNLATHRKTHLAGTRGCRAAPVSLGTATEPAGHVPERVSSPPDAPPLPGSGSAFNGALFYECTTCQSSYTDAVSYWRHIGEHSSNLRTVVPGSCGSFDGTVYTSQSDLYGTGNSQPVNSAFSCEPEMVIPIGLKIANMY